MESIDKDHVVQDGVVCPKKAPWDPRVNKLAGLPFIPMVVLACYILASSSLVVLAIWLILLVVFFYPLRYLVCARCPYYGQDCSSSLG